MEGRENSPKRVKTLTALCWTVLLELQFPDCSELLFTKPEKKKKLLKKIWLWVQNGEFRNICKASKISRQSSKNMLDGKHTGKIPFNII